MQMSDLSKKKQFKYLDVPLEHAWKVSIFTRTVKYNNQH